MFSSPCHSWALWGCALLLALSSLPLCQTCSSPHPCSCCSAPEIPQGLTAFLQSSGSSTGLAARLLCLFLGMRASSPLTFTKSSCGWFAEALPSLEEKQEGAGGDSPAEKGPLFSQRPTQNAAV